ncbi:MAG TPA: peptidoglycan binding domain-containing protein [Candidatus Blautia stercoripullorum]|uniref:Peptidoglycan binding domain-containing protein n=1 Tax=Candidatus Blautia stercoripullorum TaxID=2838502 RepID=A0A9D2RB17_9FIRM|nr:peptidoglycan binding domain-containing protein [Candidatus Blautia stercoripullorum]
MAEKKSKKGKYNKTTKTILGVLIGCAALLVIAYGIGVFYYSGHFLSGTEINGVDCSGKTVAQAEKSIESQIASYQLVLKEREDKSETISASQINMQYISDGGVQELKDQQNPFLWFLSFVRHQNYTMSANISYDEEALSTAVGSLECFKDENVVQPTDAHLEVQDGQYVIVEETQGNALDKDKVTEAVKKAIDGGETLLDLDQAGCYIEPSVLSTDENLAKQRDEGNKLLTVTVTIDFSDRQEVINGDVMKDWLTTDEEGNVDLDQAKVREYVQQLQYKYDTFGSSREFKTSSGQTITVSGGDYGWLIAPNDTTAKIIEAIKSGQSQTIEPEYTYTGYCRDTNDIGNTYVEISLDQQHMWFYKDGQLIVSTDVVTGCHNKGWDTHTGVYAIMYKERDATLVGEGYNSAVSYWMPFYANVGIHDASWRSSFGGSIYINNGSHGCVNTPTDNAAAIYNNIEKGVPVVVY